MHRIHNRNVLPWRSLLLALIVAAWGGARTPAQVPSSQPTALLVPINGTVKLQMAKKQKIKTVINPKENAVTIRTLAGDPTAVLLIGQQPDVTRIELEDTDGNKETYEVIVQADVEYLRTQLRRALPTANVTVIPTSNNTVILSGTVTHAEDVAVVRALVQSVGFKYIDSLRVGGVQQVQLDVIIAQVNRTDLRNLAINFIGNTKYFSGSTPLGGSAGQPMSIGGGIATFPPTLGAGSAMIGSPAGATNLLLGFVHNAWAFENFLIALRDNGMAKLLAEPRLVTMSGRPANFLVGGQQAVPVAAGFSGVGVQFVPFGTTLSFVPIVLGNGKIYLEVSPSVSVLDAANGVTPAGGGFVPGRDINSVTTTVELEAGQTFVIGGLIQHTVNCALNRIPWFGDLPYVGTLFRSTLYQEQELETLVIVTPWLVDAESCNQRPKILPGEETRRPDNFELFLEGIIEAPRGPRQVRHDLRYVHAWWNSPSASTFPCVGQTNCAGGNCSLGGNGCGMGGSVGAAGGLFPPVAGPGAPASPSVPQPGAVPAPLPGEVPAAMPTSNSTSATPVQTPLEPPLQPVPGEGENAAPAAGNNSSATAPESGTLR